MSKAKDVSKATRVAMRQLMGIDEIKKTFMTEKGAAKSEGGKVITDDMINKINRKKVFRFHQHFT